MALTSIFPGRVSNALSAHRLTTALADAQNVLARLQTQMATGQQFLLPSESPSAATQTLALQKLDERRNSFQSSILTNQGFLATTDQTLSGIADALIQARGLAQAAIGDELTSSEREALALDAAGLLRSVLQSANTSYGGRYLFAGTETEQAPFEVLSGGRVRYSGNSGVVAGFANFGLLVESGVNGADGLGAVSSVTSNDLDPGLTWNTRLDQLHGGAGVDLGMLRVTVNDGATTIRKDIDLSAAETLDDVRSRIEEAFSAESIQVDVDLNPAVPGGLRVTPSAGTIQVRDPAGTLTAAALGIAGGPAAAIQGSDLNPGLSLHTPVASLNGNTGIGATAGTGLQLIHGDEVVTVDLDGAATIQDVLNRIRAADPNVMVDLSDDGRGITVASRVSGETFAIGENGGDNATQLGLRTFTGSVKLADLNRGTGVPNDDGVELSILRRDGTTVEVDLGGARTVDDVLAAINAVDPGVLTARLNEFGNGISLSDSSGTGPLTVEYNEVSSALGIDGTNTGGAAGSLVGRDVHQQEAPGVFGLLSQLEKAIRDRDTATLERLTNDVDAETSRLNVVRGEIGISQRQLDNIDTLLSSQEIEIKTQLERLFDADYADVITLFTAQQQSLEAYLSMASSAMQLSIVQYL